MWTTTTTTDDDDDSVDDEQQQVDAVLARLPASLRYLPRLLSHFDRKPHHSLHFVFLVFPFAINRNATDLSRGWMWSQ